LSVKEGSAIFGKLVKYAIRIQYRIC